MIADRVLRADLGATATQLDFEVKLEMKNDFGPDSGLFLRSTEDGKAWQAMVDYHAGGNLMGIYGEDSAANRMCAITVSRRRSRRLILDGFIV
jgi:hypothetical protein